MWSKASKHMKIVLATLLLLKIVAGKNMNLSKHPFDTIADKSVPYIKALDINAQQRKAVVKIILPPSQNDKILKQKFLKARKIRQDVPNVYQLPFATMDSYMKAYHDSHKKTNYNLELKEIMHKINNFDVDHKQFSELEAIHYASDAKSPINFKQETEILQITKDDRLKNINNQENMKDLDETKAQRNMYPGVFYEDQGVTIKPHGVVGIEAVGDNIVHNSFQTEQQLNNLYTSALPSNPFNYNEKTFSQPDPIHDTNSVNTHYLNVENNQFPIVTSLFHTSAQASQDIANEGTYTLGSDLNNPLYYKLYTQVIPSTPKVKLQEQKNQNDFNYPQYVPVIDQYLHQVPSKQEHENLLPKMPVTPKINALVTQSFDISNDSMPAMVQNNYYKVEVASQTFSENPYTSEGFQNPVPNPESTNEVYHNQGLVLNSNVKQLHNEETGLSPFSEDHVSIEVNRNIRIKRNVELDTRYFQNGKSTSNNYNVKLNKTKMDEARSISNVNETFNSEALRLPFYSINNGFIPDSFVGEALDYDDDYDSFNGYLKPVRNLQQGSYDNDYDSQSDNIFDDLTLDDSDTLDSNYAPAIIPSFTNVSPKALYQTYAPAYNVPHFHRYRKPEPVYILTASQLKKLVGHHNLNIGHLDVYHLTKTQKHKMRPKHRPRRRPIKKHRNRFKPFYKIKHTG